MNELGKYGKWDQLYDPAQLMKDIGKDRLKGIRLSDGETMMKLTLEGGAPQKEQIRQIIRGAMQVYREDAERALDKQAIPQQYRELVREYYDRFENK